MIVANFTPDTVEWLHIGIVGKIAPGQVKEFDEARANHILSKYGRRGLLRMEYGDDEEVKKKEAMILYNRFWEIQIVNFNQHNETLRNENRAFVHATPDVEAHAKAMGHELVGPWKVLKSDSSKEIGELKKENAGLREDMGKLQAQLQELLVKLSVNVDDDALRRKFRHLGKDAFKPWVVENMADLLTWPAKVVLEARDKWERFYPDEPWPLKAD
ncbi:MAG: hypothetical protein V3W44_04810 [Dehalococcoidales bacterium]